MVKKRFSACAQNFFNCSRDEHCVVDVSLHIVCSASRMVVVREWGINIEVPKRASSRPSLGSSDTVPLSRQGHSDCSAGAPKITPTPGRKCSVFNLKPLLGARLLPGACRDPTASLLTHLQCPKIRLGASFQTALRLASMTIGLAQPHFQLFSSELGRGAAERALLGGRFDTPGLVRA